MEVTNILIESCIQAILDLKADKIIPRACHIILNYYRLFFLFTPRNLEQVNRKNSFTTTIIEIITIIVFAIISKLVVLDMCSVSTVVVSELAKQA